MFEISIHADADEELNAAAAFYESREPGLGEAFLHELASIFQFLREYPMSGKHLFEEYRRFQLRRFPHGVVYSVEQQRYLYWQ